LPKCGLGRQADARIGIPIAMAPIDDNSPTEEPDSPLVVALKELDDKVLAFQKEFNDKKNALRRARNEKQQPLLEKRTKIVTEGDAEESKSGTPALKSFWLTAIKNHPELRDRVEKHDEPVLEYLVNIVHSDLDAEDSDKGFKLDFIFATNPYFTNSSLTAEYHYGEYSYYREELDVKEIKGCTIDWKSGMDVTVEKVKKQAKGKKKSAPKMTTEPRDSFFRNNFRSLKEDGDLPDDIDEQQIAMMTGGEDVDEDSFMGYLIEDSHEIASEFRDRIIPWAVRWYTGEATPEQDDDDEDEEEEDSDEDDEDDDDDESEEEAPKGKKGKGKKSPQVKSKGSPKDGPKGEKGEKEECKQQ